MGSGNQWPAVAVALGFLGLIALILGVSLPRGADVDTFLKIWGGVGTLVGVATGAVPSFFFKRAADEASTRAQQAEQRAETNEQAALTMATVLDPDKHGDIVHLVQRRLLQRPD